MIVEWGDKMTELRPGDYPPFRLRGPFFEGDGSVNSDAYVHMSPEVERYLAASGLEHEPPEAKDGYEWFVAERQMDWGPAIKNMIPFMHEPFSSQSGWSYQVVTMYADPRAESYGMTIEGTDQRGVVDHLMIWQESDGPVVLMTRRPHLVIAVDLHGKMGQ